MQQSRSPFRSAASLLDARHRPSGLNSRFNGGHLPFADYVALSRDMLTKAHSALGTTDIGKIVDGNAPFEIKPSPGGTPGQNRTYRRGVLLVHGLTDSPYFMRYLAEQFQQSGFRAMAILLPGHGTQPGDLLDISWHEWVRAVAYGADRLAEEADEIYLAGLSTGGTLSVYHSLSDERVRGLFLFSPAFKVSPRAAYANLHKLYSWLIPSGKWVGIKPDSDIYKYESFPKNAAAQMHALAMETEPRLQACETSIPVFVAASEDDMTVNISATLEFFARATNPSSRLVLYTTDTGKCLPGIPAEKLELVNSVVPEQRIMSSAHTSIVVPGNDDHYGLSGEYSNCAHYYPGDMEKYSACIKHTVQVLQGEITEKNLKAGVLRRLMYNPNFAALSDSMRRFIGRLP